jgi:hypothetical protein
LNSEMGAALPCNLRVLGEPPQPAPGEVVGVIVARNEALRLGAALAEARRIGIGPIILIDNLSTDETRAVAAGFDRVHVIEAPESYAGSVFGIHWINAVLDRWARGHWALMFDADEILVYPGAEADGSLPALCAHLEQLGSECLRVVMLDLFPRQPLAEAGGWFEPPRLRQEAAADFPYVAEYGGVRERLFFPEADPSRPLRLVQQKLYNLGWRLPALRNAAWYRALAPKRSPNMTKVPLVRWREGLGFVSAHALSPVAIATEQPSGILLHFKFLQDFHARVMDAEYRRYLAALKRDPAFSLHGPRSLAYKGPAQLIDLGLMRDTPAWRRARGG